MSPNNVNSTNENFLLTSVYNYDLPYKRAKYKVGQMVRISKYKHLFEKKYTQNWTSEVFEIVEVKSTVPPTYILKDLNGVVIAGGFYQFQIQPTLVPNTYLIEKILRKSKGKYFCKFLGLGSDQNSWVESSSVI
jgi:hypothetical protein